METIPSPPHSPEAILKPSLSTMPTEILIKIARVPFFPWNFPSKRGKAATHDDKSIRSLSYTCVRLSWACQVVLYHTAVIRLDNHRLQSFLKTMKREENAHLQQYVTCLAVTYDFTVTSSICTLLHVAWPQEALLNNMMENALASGTVRLPSLRNLDLNNKGRGKVRPDCWYNLLSTLPLLEHLTLRDFREIDGDLPFPELPRLKAVHFYHCGSPYWEAPCFVTKSLLEKLPSLRTLAHRGDCGPCSPDAFEPVRDVLQTLAWVNDRQYSTHDGSPDITCLRRLRHIKTNFFKNDFGDGLWSMSLCNAKALARMESLETVEVIASLFYLDTHEAITPFRRMNFSPAEWKAMKDEFPDTEIWVYKHLGINLLLPDEAGCS
ncbi:hypothetical protein LZ31DRAFT_593836 [Colletotrichum somersetense]|nr:hypothetical protein LZ31DRAFT_593836 [Colletotrichum somersetense]